MTYDPPAIDIITTNKLGIGQPAYGAFSNIMDHEKLNDLWALDIDTAYRDVTPGVFDNLAYENASASHAQLSLLPRNAEVLQDLGLGAREAYLSHIEKMVVETNPEKTSIEAFAEQPAVDRREFLERALSEGLSPAEAIDVALTRQSGDMRPHQDILNSTALGGIPTTAQFANDVIASEVSYSSWSGSPPNFDAILSAAAAHRTGDMRSAGALVIDYTDDRKINGSSIVNIDFGEETVAVLPGGGVQMVTHADGRVAPVEAMLPEAAQALLSMIETARRQENAGKLDIGRSVVEEAKRQGISEDQ